MNLLYTPIEDSLQKDLLLFRHNNFASCVVPVENKHQYITELSKYRQELISDTQKKDEYIKYAKMHSWDESYDKIVRLLDFDY